VDPKINAYRRLTVYNVIVLVTDTYRYDNLKHRARRPVDTPCLDAFAASRAASVERAYTGSFPTIPHRTDLATGRLGWPTYGWQPIDLSSRNHIATILGKQGYATQLVCDCPHLFKARFDPAFDAAYHNRGQEGDRPLLHLNDPIIEVMPPEKTRRSPTFRGRTLADTHRWTNRYPVTEEETFPARTGAIVERWLEENYAAGPFFLWADFFDPHEPWDPPEYLVRKYDGDYSGTPMIHPNYGPSDEYTDRELHNLWAHYAAEAELVDRRLGRIITKIGDLGLFDRTVVLVTSDHGMSIGEHGRTGKSNIHPADRRFWPIYPEIGHVPMLVAAPGIEGGLSVDAFVQPVDILPTLAELSGASIDGAAEALDGISFAPLLAGKSRAGDDGAWGTIRVGARSYAVSGCFLKSESGAAPPAGATMPFLVTDSWGYAPVGATGARELYMLGDDPLAETDVAADHPAVCDELHGLLVEHLGAHRAPPELIELLAATGSGRGSWAIDYT
jgi:arylsulfatase A-like enzyme